MAARRFNPKLCEIPPEEQIYCGDGKPKAGVRKGTAYECLKKGFGAGMHTERRKYLPAGSLQLIKYVGEKYEAKFIAENINNLNQLQAFAEGRAVAGIRAMLTRVFTKAGGAGVDTRAYNETLLWLHGHGVGNLPPCVR